jgi:hypothetical protein
MKEPKPRSLEQNAKLHAMLSDVSRQIEWAGKRRSVDVWKRLMVAAWCRATGEPVEFLPAIDGQGVDVVFRRTSELKVDEVADLIEFVFSWGAENGVNFREPVIDPQTGEIVMASSRRVAA